MEASAARAEASLREPRSPRLRSSLARRLSLVLSAAWGGLIGLLPHVLHHAGPLAGAALFASAGGSILFGAIGLLAAIPFLRRVRRHTGGWRVPGAVLALMVVMFSISTLVIGPKIAGDGDSSSSDKAVPAEAIPASRAPNDEEAAAAAEPPAQGSHEAHH